MALPTGKLSSSDMGVILKIGLKIWGATPIKIWSPKPPNVENQTRSMRSKLIVGIGPENEYPKLVSKFPPKNLRGGSEFKKFYIETRLAQGSRVTLTSNFYKW